MGHPAKESNVATRLNKHADPVGASKKPVCRAKYPAVGELMPN
jgi:hypothetical protein